MRVSGLLQSKFCVMVQQPWGLLWKLQTLLLQLSLQCFAVQNMQTMVFLDFQYYGLCRPRLQQNMTGAPELEVAQGILAVFSHHPNHVIVSGSSATFTGPSLGGSELTAVFYMPCACRQHLQERM